MVGNCRSSGIFAFCTFFVKELILKKIFFYLCAKFFIKEDTNIWQTKK